jgi:hypothetical protein
VTILFNRSLVLAKEEVTFRVDPTPTPAADALLVAEPNFSADVTVLDRNNAKQHISIDPGAGGRKIATVTFSHEVRASGATDGGTAPAVGVLLKACGMAETAIVAGTGTIIDDEFTDVNHSNPIGSFTKTAAYTGTLPRVLQCEISQAGGSGAAQIDVTAPAVGSQVAISELGQTMTDTTGTINLAAAGEGTPQITLGAGATGTRVLGETFILNLTPPGFSYEPVSDNFDSCTLYVYFDGLRHIMTGARGTWTVEGEAGNFAIFNFTFTGDYVDPTDVALPTGAVFETTIPPQVELANLVAAGGEDDVDFDLCAQSFSIDIGNNVVVRDCINENESVAGAVITGRNPTAQFNPETELEATHPFWSNLSSAAKVSFSVRVGSVPGNVVTFWAPYAQYTSLAYANRNDIRAYDVTMRLATDTDKGSDGNDELRVTFS